MERSAPMSLFSKKKLPPRVAPTFTDMRIAQEQLPAETLAALTEEGILFLQPKKLSQWALSTLLMHDDKELTILPQDAGAKEFKGKKYIPDSHTYQSHGRAYW